MCESAMDEELQKGYYISPKIELVQIPGKGRGFIAREALKVGELIFKEKPLAVEERSGKIFINRLKIIYVDYLIHLLSILEFWYIISSIKIKIECLLIL
mgnify:CR=1 FL=1